MGDHFRPIDISPKRAALWLLASTLAITLAAIVARVLEPQVGSYSLRFLLAKFDTDAEQSIPAWYSSALLLASGSLLGLIYLHERRIGSLLARHWGLLAAIFVLLSLEEAVGFHELAGGVLSRMYPFTGALAFAWVIPGTAVVVFVGVTFARFLCRLPARSRWLIALAGATYVFGVLVMEMIGAWVRSQSGDGTSYRLCTRLEELLEMTGVVLFIYALLDYLHQRHPQTVIRLESPDGQRVAGHVELRSAACDKPPSVVALRQPRTT